MGENWSSERRAAELERFIEDQRQAAAYHQAPFNEAELRRRFASDVRRNSMAEMGGDADYWRKFNQNCDRALDQAFGNQGMALGQLVPRDIQNCGLGQLFGPGGPYPGAVQAISHEPGPSPATDQAVIQALEMHVKLWEEKYDQLRQLREMDNSRLVAKLAAAEEEIRKLKAEVEQGRSEPRLPTTVPPVPISVGTRHIRFLAGEPQTIGGFEPPATKQPFPARALRTGWAK